MSEETPTLNVKSHPRAAASVRRTRARVGAASFGLAAVASHLAGASTFDVGMRALGAGFVGLYVGWAAAVTVWRHILIAELRVDLGRRR